MKHLETQKFYAFYLVGLCAPIRDEKMSALMGNYELRSVCGQWNFTFAFTVTFTLLSACHLFHLCSRTLRIITVLVKLLLPRRGWR